MTHARSPQFTGRHMLGIMLAFFAVIIGVNVTMAVVATRSWTGLVVPNSYVASQEFNEKVSQARAQAELGWQARLEIAGGQLRMALTDREGQPVAATGGVANFRRPASAAEDQSIPLEASREGVVGGAQALRDGLWVAEFLIDAGLDHPYREVRRFALRQGSMQ